VIGGTATMAWWRKGGSDGIVQDNGCDMTSSYTSPEVTSQDVR
jgi:hypothetical protein